MWPQIKAKNNKKHSNKKRVYIQKDFLIAIYLVDFGSKHGQKLSKINVSQGNFSINFSMKSEILTVLHSANTV